MTRPAPSVPGNPFLTAAPDPAAAVRLFCFHHAGGGASSFADWQAGLGPAVSVVPVQLPGRENRSREPAIRDMAGLLDELDARLAPWWEEPYALYGHSMGAFVAHALVRRRMAAGGTLPQRLLIGAARAPHLPIVLSAASDMPDRELGELLVGLGGMSEVLLRYPDWLSAATSLVRDDLDVCSTNPYREPRPVPVPLVLFAGADDPLVDPQDVAAWAAHTSAGTSFHLVPGGHFFPKDSGRVFLKMLSDALTEDGGPRL